MNNMRALLLSLFFFTPLQAAQVSPRWGPVIGSALPLKAKGAAGIAAGNLSEIGSFKLEENSPVRSPFELGRALEILAPVALRLEAMKYRGAWITPEGFEKLDETVKARLLSRALEAETARVKRRAEAIIQDYKQEKLLEREDIERHAAESEGLLMNSYFFMSDRERELLKYAHDAFLKQSRAPKRKEVITKARREMRRWLEQNPEWPEAQEAESEAPVPEMGTIEALQEAWNLMGLIREGLQSLSSADGDEEGPASEWQEAIYAVETLLHEPGETKAEDVNRLLEETRALASAYERDVRQSNLNANAKRLRSRQAERLVGLLSGLYDRLRPQAEPGPEKAPDPRLMWRAEALMAALFRGASSDDPRFASYEGGSRAYRRDWRLAIDLMDEALQGTPTRLQMAKILRLVEPLVAAYKEGVKGQKGSRTRDAESLVRILSRLAGKPQR